MWADPVATYHDTSVSRVHVATDLLTDVADRQQAIEALVPLNRVASLSGLAVDAGGTVRLEASVAVTGDNATLVGSLALHAMAIQAADAHIKAAPLADFLSARVAGTAHPSHGRREAPDEILDALAFYADKGQGASPFGALDFAQMALMQPRPWVLATARAGGLDVELPFLGSHPSILHGHGAAAPETALLQVRTDHRHPQLGAGLLLRLALPLRGPAALANDLNLAEAAHPEGHHLGAWTIDQRNLAFYTFVPAVAFADDLVETLIWHAAARAQWARDRLYPAPPRPEH